MCHQGSTLQYPLFSQAQNLVEFEQRCPSAEVCSDFGIKPPEDDNQLFKLVHAYSFHVIQGHLPVWIQPPAGTTIPCPDLSVKF